MVATKILLVEDDVFIADMYATKFNQIGYKVDSATSGGEALKKLAKDENHYDLVLLDLVMPDVDGFDVLAEIRANEKRKDINIIVLSNLSQDEEVARAKDFDIIGYLVKANHTPQEVVDEVAEILKAHQSKAIAKKTKKVSKKA